MTIAQRAHYLMLFFHERGGSYLINDRTNLDPTKLWSNILDVIWEKYNVRCRRKSPYTTKDVLFMTLTTLRHGGQWEVSARTFGLKNTTFQRPIRKFIIMLSEPLYQGLVCKKYRDITNGSDAGR